MLNPKKHIIIFSILYLFCAFGSCQCGFITRWFNTFTPQKIAIIGTGYVGLTGGAVLSKMGHDVICVDIDKKKIDMLNAGKMPIYEPGLKNIVKKNFTKGSLSFTSNAGKAIRSSDVIIVAVGTPEGKNEEANLQYLESAIKTIGQNLNKYKVICIKSTVPFGTNEKMKKLLEENTTTKNVTFDMVSNPEFLRAGSALDDFFKRNPILIGSDSKKALDIIENVYAPLKKNGISFIKTNFATAEMSKYVWNCLVAYKVGGINEFSRLCNEIGADIDTIKEVISHEDKILPFKNVRPGPGFGGSCLPKDTRAFIKMAEKIGVEMKIIKGIIESNKIQKTETVKQLYKLLGGSIKGKKIGILGLSFKANTDDIRRSPAIEVIKKLRADGAIVKAFDPQAAENMKRLFPKIMYCDSIDQAAKDSDALIVLTDWQQIKDLDLKNTAKNMNNNPVIVDAKNLFDPKDLEENGFSFANFGRRS